MNRFFSKKYIFVLCLILFKLNFSAFALQANVEFTVANILQSNMVVQQNKPFKLWGTAKAGDKIIIKADWEKKPLQIISDNFGNWIGQIEVPKAKKGNFTKHTINITHQEKNVVLNNILIGEVWLCSGQSNMELTMQPVPPWHKGVENNKEEIANANYPNIRLFKIPRDTSSVLETEAIGNWKECAPNSVNDFSGVAYYFGRVLLNKLDIPIGLVTAAYGGASCQAFIPKEVLRQDILLKKKYLDKYLETPKAVQLTDKPSLIYNKMINPLTNLSIRGFLWYQGESNASDKNYTKLCSAMLKSWRANFTQGDLPFYYVQMTPYNWKSEDEYQDYYAYFRDRQEAMLKINNTGMAVTMDVGEPYNIHPQKKKEVGQRLAKIALNQTYHQKDIQCFGPTFKNFKIVEGEIIISFTKASVKSWLETKDGLSPRYFFVASDDKVFKQVEARISGKNVVLLSKNILKPVSIRYAFINAPITNLENKEGLPAQPFRTDNWDFVTYK